MRILEGYGLQVIPLKTEGASRRMIVTLTRKPKKYRIKLVRALTRALHFRYGHTLACFGTVHGISTKDRATIKEAARRSTLKEGSKSSKTACE